MQGTVTTQSIAGQRFNHLVAVSPAGRANGVQLWRCNCDCGKTVNVQSNHLRNGYKRDCGHASGK